MVCDPMVDGRIFFRRQMSLQYFQSSNFIFALVGFVVEISSKLRVPDIVYGSPKVIYVAH